MSGPAAIPQGDRAVPDGLPTTSQSDHVREAIQRIRNGPHSSMPAPSVAPANGPAGEGMTVQNHTSYALTVYFSGATDVSMIIPPGASRDVALVTGKYQVAVEIPDSRVTPYFGEHTYETRTHYWLSFSLK
jgi:hypothetical protein